MIPQKIGILWLWHIAHKHVSVLQELWVTHIYGYDILASQWEIFQEKYAITLTESLEQLIDISDLIVICTPHNTHSFLAKEITSQGKICLCEKPLGIKSEEFQDFSTEEKTRIICILQNRLNNAVVQTKEIIDTGTLWDIYHIKWYTQWNRDDAYYSGSDWKGRVAGEGGMLYNQWIHNLDTALYLLGYRWGISKINTLSKTKKRLRTLPIETEDYFSCSMELWNTLYDFSILTYGDRNHHENSLIFYGTQWTLKIGGKALNTLEYCDINWEKNIEKLACENPSDIYGSGHYKLYKMILEGRQEELPRFEDGLRMVDLLEKLYSETISTCRT